MNEINAEFLVARLGRKYFIPFKEENLKVGGKRNMKRTHDELLAGFPKSQITQQICLSFSTPGRFTTGGIIQIVSDNLNVFDLGGTRDSYCDVILLRRRK